MGWFSACWRDVFCGTGEIAFIPRFFVLSGTAPRVPRMRSGAGPERLLRAVRSSGFWWRYRFLGFYRTHQFGFAEELFPGFILLYIFDGDRCAGGRRAKSASRKKISGEVFSRCSVIAPDMGFSLFIEPRLGFDHFRCVNDYYVVSIFKINPFPLKNPWSVLRFQGF